MGAAIQIGPTPISLTSVLYTERFSAGPMPGEIFQVFSRNADGTVGGPSPTGAFTLSYDSTTQNTTALPTSPFTFQADTSYWLMMVETTQPFGDWDNSTSATYTSSFGVTLPDQNASFALLDGSPTYYGATRWRLELFQVNGTPAISAIPEPSASPSPRPVDRSCLAHSGSSVAARTAEGGGAKARLLSTGPGLLAEAPPGTRGRR